MHASHTKLMYVHILHQERRLLRQQINVPVTTLFPHQAPPKTHAIIPTHIPQLYPSRDLHLNIAPSMNTTRRSQSNLPLSAFPNTSNAEHILQTRISNQNHPIHSSTPNLSNSVFHLHPTSITHRHEPQTQTKRQPTAKNPRLKHDSCATQEKESSVLPYARHLTSSTPSPAVPLILRSTCKLQPNALSNSTSLIQTTLSMPLLLQS